ncbi:MAG: AEC family transporter [Lachnospiraceae bacterium]|nr:AEC family transporter [Lachnospiraceae bacterium]
MVLQSIKSVFALMTLIGIGYYFTGKPWFGKPGMDFLSKFTVDVTIPFYMFYNIYQDIGSRKALLSLVFKLPVTFSLILLCIGLATAVGTIVRVSEGRRFTFVAAAGFSNVVFIGFPVIQTLWGSSVTSIGVIYYISSTVLFWTLGVWLLQKDGRTVRTQEGRPFAGLKNLISPPIMGMLFAMAAIFFGIQVPDFILKPLSMITGVTSPLALIFIGSVIRNMDQSSIKFGRDIYAALAMRFIVVPAVAAVFLRLMPVASDMKQVFFMLSTMPSMTQMGIMAREYKSDYGFACEVVMLTTIISLFTIPLFMFLIQKFSIF